MLVRALVLSLIALLRRILDALSPPPLPPPPEEDSTALDALKAAGEILKVSTGLATGALVFSVGLLPSAASTGPVIHAILAITWVILFLSVIGGVLAQSAIPVLMAENRLDLEAPTFTWPGRVHQVLFGFAVLGLAIVLTAALYADGGQLRVRDAQAATTLARQSLHTGETPDRLDVVELVHGLDPNRQILASWHVRFHLQSAQTVDVLLDPKSGRATRIP
jgi:hypothetical protein